MRLDDLTLARECPSCGVLVLDEFRHRELHRLLRIVANLVDDPEFTGFGEEF